MEDTKTAATTTINNPRVYKRFPFEYKVRVVRKYLDGGDSKSTMLDFIQEENRAIEDDHDKLQYGAFTYWVKNKQIMTAAVAASKQQQQQAHDVAMAAATKAAAAKADAASKGEQQQEEGGKDSTNAAAYENNLDLLVSAALSGKRPSKKPRRYFTFNYKTGIVRDYLLEVAAKRNSHRRPSLEHIIRQANPGINSDEVTVHCNAFPEWLRDSTVVEAAKKRHVVSSNSSSTTSNNNKSSLGNNNNNNSNSSVKAAPSPFSFQYRVYLVRKYLNEKCRIESLVWEANQRIRNHKRRMDAADFRSWMMDKNIMVAALKAPPTGSRYYPTNKKSSSPKTYSFQFKVDLVRNYLKLSQFKSIRSFVREQNTIVDDVEKQINYGALARWLKERPILEAAKAGSVGDGDAEKKSISNSLVPFSFDFKVDIVAKYLNGGIYQNLESVVKAANQDIVKEEEQLEPATVQTWLKDKTVVAAVLKKQQRTTPCCTCTNCKSSGVSVCCTQEEKQEQQAQPQPAEVAK